MPEQRTIVDYVERTFASFSDLPVNEVDSLAFCQLAYLRIGETFPDATTGEGRLLRDLFQAENLERLYGGLRDPKPNARLIAAFASSPRFREVRVCRYVNDVDADRGIQFSATCFLLPNGDTFVAFRGTDMTIVGWKEDFNLAVSYPVPAQIESLAYLLECAEATTGNLFVGGHSKGGNLATYCSMNAPVKVHDRIVRVFDHDGPGFYEEVVESDAFVALIPKVSKTVPQLSVFGQLFETVPVMKVVQSNGIGTLMQHDPYTWLVDVENASFVDRGKLDAAADYGRRTLDDWLRSMDADERERFIEAFFLVCSSGGATGFGEGEKVATPIDAFKTIIGSDEKVRAALYDGFGKLLHAAANKSDVVNAPLESKEAR